MARTCPSGPGLQQNARGSMNMNHACLAVLVWCSLVAAHPAVHYTPTPHGVLVQVGKAQVELAVQGTSAFRVSVSFKGTPVQIDSPMLETPATYLPFTPFSQGSTVGIRTDFGQQSIDTTSALYTLAGQAGNTLTTGILFSPTTLDKDTCASPRDATDITSGQRVPAYPDGVKNTTQDTCCALCNKDADCTVWVWADAQHPDASGSNCWLMKGVTTTGSRDGRVLGGDVAGSIVLALGKTNASALLFGAGGGFDTVTSITATSSNPHVSNTEFYVPHFWSTDGYAALGVSPWLNVPGGDNIYAASWASSAKAVTWQIGGDQADLYLMPADTMREGLQVYYNLIGAPRKLPRYAYGFMACRWGWSNRSYIEDMLQSFRNGSFPIDAFISDFEWYTPQPDYSLPSSGSPTFVDFSYNNVTFPDPINQLNHYHKDLHLRFGGIRKPRLGNTDLLNMARANGWLIDTGRNLNFSVPEVRDWYSRQIAHFLPDGVNFWWNDEGETMYFTFHYWNVAQLKALNTFLANKRFFTINRSYSPGMQRFGVVTWTGDIPVSWQSMQHQPAYAVSWTLAGSPHVACDIGGFNGPNDPAHLLARWYQLGVFLPIMRVHSTLGDLPHFPFLYGDAAAHAMRNALNLRYQLLPYTYSLAHRTFAYGDPITGPLYMSFPSDPNVLSIYDQWLFGSHLMAAPIVTSADGQTTDTSRQVYLPQGLWYQLRYGADSFSAGTTIGPATITCSDVALDQILFFTRAGAIIPMAPVLQYSDALPGGPLNVLIFPGADGHFQMFEDDGETTAYENDSAVTMIDFTWTDSTRTLTWSVMGAELAFPQSFVQVYATAYFAAGSKTSATSAIGNSGRISF